MIKRAEMPEDLIVYDPEELDAAILGIGIRCSAPDIVVYDREKLLEVFMEMNGWTDEEADEWISFNIEGGWLGPGTPIILQRIDE